jgi:hypothetical protein
MSLEMAQKVIVPQKKNYVPQFLKQRDINSYFLQYLNTCVFSRMTVIIVAKYNCDSRNCIIGIFGDRLNGDKEEIAVTDVKFSKTDTENPAKFVYNSPVLRIWDVYPGSEFFHPGSRVKKILDPGSTSKN